MRNTPIAVALQPAALLAAPTDRRSRGRLRDLCDEVLASYRAASAREVISEQDRRDSVDILSAIAPLSRR